jgi:hypothetical protein
MAKQKPYKQTKTPMESHKKRETNQDVTQCNKTPDAAKATTKLTNTEKSKEKEKRTQHHKR